jgi:glycosyltransferase involved in cell wall biosynthesis
MEEQRYRNRNKNRENKSQDFKNPKRNYKKKELFFSVVIPLLNEEESLPELSQKLEEELNKIAKDSYEVIFIDDGSTDNSYEVIKQINQKNNRFKAIRFRRNFGKSAALSVGFDRAKGRYVATMDADLQDDPKELSNLLDKMRAGYDLVSGWKRDRHDPISKTLPSKLFNYVTSKTSGIKLHDFNCGLKLYKREVVKSLHVYGEMHRYLPALAHWQGFKVTEQPVEHHPRIYGYSKFGISRFLNGYLDLLTVLFTTRYVKRPLHFFGFLGTFIAFVGFCIDLVLSIQWALGLTSLSNRPLALLGIAMIIVGVQFISMGLIGEIIVKSNIDKTKNIYSIKEKL